MNGVLGPTFKAALWKEAPAAAECGLSDQQAPLLTKPFQGLAQVATWGYRAAQRHLGVGGQGGTAASLEARRPWATRCLLPPFLWTSVVLFVQWALNSSEF